jgi:hypothetical protein
MRRATSAATTVWTSVGVLAGVGLVALTGWTVLDPLVALAVAANIIRVGVSLVRRSMLGLLDTAPPEDVRAAIARVFTRYEAQGVRFHALRTRQAGARSFISTHVLVPGDWTVRRGHDLLEEIEGELRAVVPNTTVSTHLEPGEDPVSWADTHDLLHRVDAAAPVQVWETERRGPAAADAHCMRSHRALEHRQRPGALALLSGRVRVRDSDDGVTGPRGRPRSNSAAAPRARSTSSPARR